MPTSLWPADQRCSPAAAARVPAAMRGHAPAGLRGPGRHGAAQGALPDPPLQSSQDLLLAHKQNMTNRLLSEDALLTTRHARHSSPQLRPSTLEARAVNWLVLLLLLLLALLCGAHCKPRYAGTGPALQGKQHSSRLDPSTWPPRDVGLQQRCPCTGGGHQTPGHPPLCALLTARRHTISARLAGSTSLDASSCCGALAGLTGGRVCRAAWPARSTRGMS